ncbi:protein Jade-1 [Fistulifera solaris]|uniref:Protein Jade-1 n=1 Tax=Fistulifera solaris TaxID=1519565 RepID=A0A1Z5KGI1_FISSO|nr:protein Jade-1 [Fistulifera solaris]|eukprot:GAX25359.1 protein Jade-1 [Fistulifera solaris]
MKPGTLKRRVSQALSDDGSSPNAEDSVHKSPSKSADRKDRSLVSAKIKRGATRRKSNPDGTPRRRGRPPKSQDSNVSTKRPTVKRQNSMPVTSVIVKSDDAPTRLVNPLIEWPPAVNDPYIDPNKRQRLSVDTPAPAASVLETTASCSSEAAPKEPSSKASNSDVDFANVKRTGRVGDMVQMLDLERPDTFPLAWQAQLLGLSLPEVIRVDDDILKQIRDANPIDEFVEFEEVCPVQTNFQWSWRKEEEDETKLLSERDPVYVSLLNTSSQKESFFHPISTAQFNKLHQSVVLDTSPILALAQECGLWTPGSCSFSLMPSTSGCFGWDLLSKDGPLGSLKTQVEWYSVPELERNELVSRWQSFQIGTHHWIDDSMELDNRKRKKVERSVGLASLEASVSVSGDEKDELLVREIEVAVKPTHSAMNETHIDNTEPQAESLMILLFTMALEHARACGISYILIENMSLEWKTLLTTYFRMTVKQEMVESKTASLVCDLMKISHRYTFLLFQQQMKDPTGQPMKESDVPVQDESRCLRCIASIAPAVIIAEDESAEFCGAAEALHSRLAIFRASLNPTIEFVSLRGDEKSGDKIDHVVGEPEMSFHLIRSFQRQPERIIATSEVCDEINIRGKELVVLESNLQPKLHDLMASSIKERVDFEQLCEKREKERYTIDESVKLIERRREQDLAFQRQQEQDMEAVCVICGDGEVTPDNQMVFCESCDVAVHQICYGIEKVPEGDYYCYACTRLQRESVIPGSDEGGSPQLHRVCCELCPLRTGAFIETATKADIDTAPFGKWIHVVCAKWQGLRFERSPDVIEDVSDLKVRFRQYGIKCSLCNGERGAMIKCRHEECKTWVHVTCARAVGNCVVVHGENASGDIETNPWTLLCPKHSQIPTKDIPVGSLSVEKLALLAKEFPPEPQPPPADVVPRPFNTIGGEEREMLLRNEEYERALLVELTTKRLNGYRCEVCDTLEVDGKNMLRCPSCLTICCVSCRFDSDDSDSSGYKCQSCRFLEKAKKTDEGSEVPACLLCCQKGGVLRPACAKTIGRKSYWKNNPDEYQKSFFGKNIWVHSVCGFWIPKVEVSCSGVVNCSDVVMANGKGLILAQSRCFLCGQSDGLKIRCSDDCCSRQRNSEQSFYHVTCARQAGLEVNVSGDDDLIFYMKCYKHCGNDFNFRAKIEDLLEIEKRRSGKLLSKYHMPMTFSHAQRLLNSAIQVMRTLGWAWRWAEWWVDYDSSWEPLLEPGQIESKMTKEELKIVESFMTKETPSTGLHLIAPCMRYWLLRVLSDLWKASRKTF